MWKNLVLTYSTFLYQKLAQKLEKFQLHNHKLIAVDIK